jgi:bilirubin oxidase
MVVHVHGSHVADTSDGYPESWFLPHAKNIPAGYFRQGTHYQTIAPVGPGQALYQYDNTQRPTTLWFHDHSLGITRNNIYAGLAGFWLVRDSFEQALNLPGPAPQIGDRPGMKYYEIPLMIQDRSFNTDGSLFYPHDRAFFDGITNVFPASDIPPIWNPEFFGNTMLVNGTTWPFLKVDQHRYRFRLLNACNSRTVILVLQLPSGDSLAAWQIGNDGGFLPAPLLTKSIRLGPAERADVIVDFGKTTGGTTIVMRNFAPDEPFQDEEAMQTPADSGTTGIIMQFTVRRNHCIDRSVDPSIPGRLILETLDSIKNSSRVRDLTLNEMEDPATDEPVRALLGTLDGTCHENRARGAYARSVSKGVSSEISPRNRGKTDGRNESGLSKSSFLKRSLMQFLSAWSGSRR